MFQGDDQFNRAGPEPEPAPESSGGRPTGREIPDDPDPGGQPHPAADKETVCRPEPPGNTGPLLLPDNARRAGDVCLVGQAALAQAGK